jgi:SAM-dependent methyltransferase
MNESREDTELHAIASRYALRDRQRETRRYSWLQPDVHLSMLENDRVMLQLFSKAGFTDLSRLALLEVGCGNGGNLVRFLRWGFDPVKLVGNDLISSRLEDARKILPASVRLVGGDACLLDCGQFDVVYQSTVFSSILDDAFQERLAAHMWEMTRPGGGILWYDFCFNNPANPDVRGVPIRRIRALFPGGSPVTHRVTLAPPISRLATRFSTRLYPLLNALPLLRTHALCWIAKPPSSFSSTVKEAVYE